MSKANAAVEKALPSDFFELFGLPRTFALDSQKLEQCYRDIQGKVHPDRFMDADAAQKRRSLQWSSQVNDAYRTLKNPLQRAVHLLNLAGLEMSSTGTRLSTPLDFLSDQMEWRESLMVARQTRDLPATQTLETRLEDALATRYAALETALNAETWEIAQIEVNCLMFLEKLRQEISDTLESLEG